MIFIPNPLEAPRLRLAAMVVSAGAAAALLMFVKMYKRTNVQSTRC